MLKPGMRIGDWIIVRPLAEGGMGSVFEVHNRKSTRIKAALKVIKPHELEAEERFIREAESLYALRNPAIVRVSGFGEDDELGVIWLAMEMVEGENFEHVRAQGPMPPDRAAEVFRKIANGLAHAHSEGIFHRDIKPANLMIRSKDNQPVIVDFGIAADASQTKLTKTGMVPGTIAYLPPEIFSGDPPAPDATDIYALGLVLYELLAGREAYPLNPSLSGPAQMAMVMTQKVSSESMDPGEGTPGFLRDLIRRATDPEPENRLKSMAEFAAALEGPVVETPTTSVEEPVSQTKWVADVTVEPKAPSSSGPVERTEPSRPPKKGKGLLLAGGLMGVLVVGAVVLAIPVVIGLVMGGMNGFQTQYAGARVLCDAPNNCLTLKGELCTFRGPTDEAMVALAKYIDENLGNRAVRASLEDIVSAGRANQGDKIRVVARRSGLEDWETCAYAAAFDTRATFFGPDVSIEMTFKKDPDGPAGSGIVIQIRGSYRSETWTLEQSEQLQLALQALAKEDPDRVITIEAEPNVTYMDLVSLMDMARTAGLHDIVIAERPPTGGIPGDAKRDKDQSKPVDPTTEKDNKAAAPAATPVAAAASAGQPTTLGAVDRSEIAAVVKRHMSKIRYCYEKELQNNPSLAGKVVVKFVIAPDGSVSKASVKSSTLANATAEDCILRSFKRMRFSKPKGGGISVITYPFVFESNTAGP